MINFKKLAAFSLMAYGVSVGSGFCSSGSAAAAPVEDLTEKLLSKGVIVRVWSGELFDTKVDGVKSVGHVSLNTNQDYVSFWPPYGGSGDLRGQFLADLNADLEAEGKNPETTIFLPCTDSNAANGIHQDFEFLKSLLGQKKLIWEIDGGKQALKSDFTQEGYASGLALLPHCTPAQKKLFGIYEIWSFNCASVVINLLQHRGYLGTEGGDPIISPLNTTVSPDRAANICSEVFLRKVLFPGKTSYSIYLAINAMVQAKGGESITSHHKGLFGQRFFKSANDQVIVNESCVEEMIEEIKREKAEGFAPVMLRTMLAHGMAEWAAELFK